MQNTQIIPDSDHNTIRAITHKHIKNKIKPQYYSTYKGFRAYQETYYATGEKGKGEMTGSHWNGGNR